MLTTYTELKSDIATYLHRSDLTDVIPAFISLAQKRIVRDLIQRGGHAKLEASSSITPTANVATLPADFESIRSLVTGDSSPVRIQAIPLDVLNSSYSVSGTGHAYAKQGDTIILSPDAGDSTVTLYYYKTPADMGVSVATNELYPDFSDLYLYASLIEGCMYIQTDPTVWASAYSNAMDSVIKTNRVSAWANGMSVRAA